jgi:L-asparaginase/Glu-tRNA(Gln) amidotransferase subunit D
LNLFVDEPDASDTGEDGQETSMNHSIYSADRTTHLKIVVVALVVGIVVAGFGISARNSSDEGFTQTARVMKAGKPVVITSSGSSVVR